jgi:predicted GIY-YIG superfamily endonuclease
MTHNFTKSKTNTDIDEYMNSDVYEVTCVTNKLSFVGQTSHDLKQRYQEHKIYTTEQSTISICPTYFKLQI